MAHYVKVRNEKYYKKVEKELGFFENNKRLLLIEIENINIKKDIEKLKKQLIVEN